MPANTWRRMPSFYNLMGSKCSACSQLFFPPSQVCRNCGSTSLSEHAFNGEGKIVTYTVIRQPFNDDNESEQLISSNPYVIAIVQFEEGPMITAQITDAEPEEVQMGSPVKAVFRKISEEGEEGLIRYGYKFVLA